MTARRLSFLYEDNPADPLDLLCGWLHPSSRSVSCEFIARCGTDLEEPAHLAQAHNFLRRAAN